MASRPASPGLRRLRAGGAVLRAGAVRTLCRDGDRGSHRRGRHVHRQLRRPALPRGAAGRDRMAAAPAARAEARAPTAIPPTTTSCAPARRAASRLITSASCSARWPSTWQTKFGTKGSPISLSTACASGATAIQLGVEAIRRGEAEAALCVGTDGSVNPESLIRFSLLSALSTQNDPPDARRRNPSPRTATAS